jgi:hypothetical protein
MGTIFASGIHQEDLIAAMTEIATDWQATIDKVEADLGDVDWSANNVSLRSEFSQGGVSQEAIIAQCQEFVTSLNAINAEMDADDGVTKTDFVALCNVTDTINELTQNDGLFDIGVFQGRLVRLLYDIKTKMNAFMANCDADGSLTDTDYASTNGIDFAIDVEGC